MKLRWITLLLLGVMGALLALSEQAGQAVRQGLSLCAGSVIPSLFPFFVLSSLFTSLGGGAMLWRLPFFSRQGSTIFFLGALGGYPLGGRLIGQLVRSGGLEQQEAQKLLCCCNNAGPAFILGLVGLGRFGSLRAGLWLYLIHVAAALLLALALRPGGAGCTASLPPATQETSLASALVDAIAAAGATMVQICAFVVFFVTALSLLQPLPPFQLPLVRGLLELTNGVTGLENTPAGFVQAAFLLGWGGISVHCQTAAVLEGTGLSMGRYMLAKGVQGLLSALLAAPIAGCLF